MKHKKNISRACLFAVPIVALLAQGPALAQSSASGLGDADLYLDCLGLIKTDADQAYEHAVSWREIGGGAPAIHCSALALIALEHFGPAAEKLEELAIAPSTGDTDMRADVLVQAGNSWLLAGSPQNAHGAFGDALKLKPNDPDILTERARASADMQEWLAASTDLSAALTIDPSHIDAYIFRASARRKLAQHDLAREDIELAIALTPERSRFQLSTAYLERGLINLELGDEATARQDWIKILTIDTEGGPADEARRQLEKLDVKID